MLQTTGGRLPALISCLGHSLPPRGEFKLNFFLLISSNGPQKVNNYAVTFHGLLEWEFPLRCHQEQHFPCTSMLNEASEVNYKGVFQNPRLDDLIFSLLSPFLCLQNSLASLFTFVCDFKFKKSLLKDLMFECKNFCFDD